MQMTIDIPDEQVSRLDRLQLMRGTTRDQIVCEALNVYLPAEPLIGVEGLYITPPAVVDAEVSQRIIDRAFGSWNQFAEDAVDYQRRMRNEWTREWDPEPVSDRER